MNISGIEITGTSLNIYNYATIIKAARNIKIQKWVHTYIHTYIHTDIKTLYYTHCTI